MEDKPTDVRQEMDNLKEDINRLRADLADILQTTKRQGQATAEGLKTKFRGEAMNRMNQLKDILDSAKDYSYKAYNVAQRKVEDKPLASILTAFVVGLVVGKLFKNRR